MAQIEHLETLFRTLTRPADNAHFPTFPPQPHIHSGSRNLKLSLGEMEKKRKETSRLLSLPIEVQINILQSCDSYTQALSLVGTCRQLYSLWTTYSTSIVSYIGRNSIPAFDDALMTIRATIWASEYYHYMVHKSHSLPTESPPPPSKLSIRDLSSPTSPKATITETKSVLNLKLFVDYSLYLSHTPITATHLACLVQSSTYIPLPFACMYRECKQKERRPNTLDVDIPSEFEAGSAREVERRVYVGMYTLFTISALMTNRYYAPFFEEGEIPRGLREGYSIFWPREVKNDPNVMIEDVNAGGAVPEEYREYFEPIRKLTDEEVEYLAGWDVFNKRRFREGRKGGLMEEFDEIGEWVCTRFNHNRARDIRSDDISDLNGIDVDEDGKRKFNIETAAEIQQLMILNNCYEVWTRMRERMDSLAEPVRLTHEKLLYALYKDKVNLTTIPVVFHPIYGVGDAMMPKTIQEFLEHPYGPVPPNLQGKDNDGKPLKHVEVSDVIYQLVGVLGQELGEGPAGQVPIVEEDGTLSVVGGDAGKAFFEFGWPEYAFWEHVMKKRFGMRVDWKWTYLDNRYDEFVKCGEAFTMGAEGFRGEIPGVLKYYYDETRKKKEDGEDEVEKGV
ncbi:hypothetical protein TWF694_008051 [Orbilia ellipsospora]|uniref:F-box domain-containing protein n=1 Tax=Orbilia ellipsospora TaxID=2528407 RepID=A0AAV9XFH6_9PEZI